MIPLDCLSREGHLLCSSLQAILGLCVQCGHYPRLTYARAHRISYFKDLVCRVALLLCTSLLSASEGVVPSYIFNYLFFVVFV
jgi:hypothetical protein